MLELCTNILINEKLQIGERERDRESDRGGGGGG
jgi:hypothetical protein